MGIRIHKMLGWGLTDLQIKPGSEANVLDDPRINPRGYLALRDALDGEEQVEKRFDYDAYRKFLKTFRWRPATGERKTSPIVGEPSLEKNAAGTPSRVQVIRSGWPFQHVVHESEFGLACVLCIRPTAFADWFRYDDTLDWIEETQHFKQECRVQPLTEPPFPYRLRVDTKTNKVIRGERAERLHFEWDREKGRPKGCGWRWLVPADVAAVCKFLKLFRSDETIRELEPMIYVWWS